MDVSIYKEEFLAEARIQIALLEKSFIVLEKNLSDEEAINTTYRVFHTLKGDAVTMGYLKFSELAYSFEKIMYKIKYSKLKINQEVMAILLEAYRVFSKSLDLISQDSLETLDMDNLKNELEIFYDERTRTANSKEKNQNEEKKINEKTTAEKTTDEKKSEDDLSPGEFKLKQI